MVAVYGNILFFPHLTHISLSLSLSLSLLPRYNSMLFENGENVNAEAVDASSALGITSYSTPSNLVR